MADPALISILDLVSIQIPGYNEEQTELTKESAPPEAGVYINDIGQKVIIKDRSDSPNKLTKL